MWGTGVRALALVPPSGSSGQGGSGCGSVCALSVVCCVRARTGAVGPVMCRVWCGCGVILDARVGELPGGVPC